VELPESELDGEGYKRVLGGLSRRRKGVLVPDSDYTQLVNKVKLNRMTGRAKDRRSFVLFPKGSRTYNPPR
jgi:hypothetical protein